MLNGLRKLFRSLKIPPMINLKAFKLMDQDDPLKLFRNHFFHQKNEIYLDGNSLGKMPKNIPEILGETINNQWGKQLISSWNKGWLKLPNRLSEKYGKLLNASAEEIVFGESTTVRLYQILLALIQSGNYLDNLITDNLNFPTDLYVIDGLKKQFPKLKINNIEYHNEIEADIDLLKESIKKNPGIICLSLVTYKSCYYYPMKVLNQYAVKHKSIIVWDISHGVGSVPIDFKESETKIAVGCTYKYMNGGPGSPSFLYIESGLHSLLENPIQGWFGHKNPFDFNPQYKSAEKLDHFKNGTPPILSMQAVESGIDLTLKAGILNIRDKSIKQSEMIIMAIKDHLNSFGYNLQSPKKFLRRGSHIAISHPNAWQICQALQKGGKNIPKIIPDFRPPNFIRLGITPLYTSFEDLWWVINQLENIVESESYLRFNQIKPEVT